MTDTATKPQDLDAFPDDADGEADDEAIARIDRASGGTSGEGLAFAKLELNATLQDAKVSKASNGDNYDVTYEVDIEGFVRIAVESAKGKGGFDLEWDSTNVGSGVELKRLSSSRDADGAMHYRIHMHLPQSEIARSLGRIGVKLGKQAKMVLTPMQGELGLPGGEKVDLTAKADA